MAPSCQQEKIISATYLAVQMLINAIQINRKLLTLSCRPDDIVPHLGALHM